MDALTRPERFDAWLPIRVFWRDGQARVDWCYFGESRLTQPLFRDSVTHALRQPFNLAFRRETPVDALREWRAASPGLEPTAFLYHASRCGSTLVARMLAALDTHIVVSEPPMLDAVLSAHRLVPDPAQAPRIEWLRGLVSALAQPRNGEAACVVTLDAWTVLDLDLMRKAFPDTPWIYLYRDPLEIAVSQLRERAAFMIPGVVSSVAEIFDPQELGGMRPEEFVARVLGKMLEAGNAGCMHAGGPALRYDELPQALWTSHRQLLGVRDDPHSLEALRNAARRSTESPHTELGTDPQRQQCAASSGLRALVDRWAAPAYRALERTRSGAPGNMAAP